MRVRDIPDGYWFELVRNGVKYYRLCQGEKKYHVTCVRLGEKKPWNMSGQSYAKLIKQLPKPKIRIQ